MGEGVAEVSGKDRIYRALQTIARTLTFALRGPLEGFGHTSDMT